MKVEKGYCRTPTKLERFAAEIYGFQPASVIFLLSAR